MPAYQHPRRLGHRRSVQGLSHPPDVFLEERRPARGDLVEIGPRHGVVTGVKGVLHLGYVDDADVGGKALIQGAQDRVHWSETRLNARFWTDPQVGRLSPGMHTGISASGALDVDGSSEE